LKHRSTTPNFVLLGSPIGDAHFCASHIDMLRTKNKKLLDAICQLEDPQVSLHLLRTCASFCKFVYIARTTPPQLIYDPLKQCDIDFRSCLARLAALQLSDMAWSQAQLALSSGGLGLRSTSRHCTAAYISSHTRSLPKLLTSDLQAAFQMFSEHLGEDVGEQLTSRWLEEPPTQHSLSVKLEKKDLVSLVAGASIVDRIRLHSVSSSRSSAWLQALPCRGPFDLTLLPNEMQIALQHRLGIPLSQAGDVCDRCSKHAELDLLGHHQLTCSTGGYVSTRHNRLRDNLSSLCSIAGLNPKKEQGASFGDLSRPADLLIDNWTLGKSAAIDLTVVSPLVIDNVKAAGAIDVISRAAALKHEENDAKCAENGWTCVPLAVDCYGQWCEEAHSFFAQLATSLSVRTSVSFSNASNLIYNTLGLVLARRNAYALLSCRRPFSESVGRRELLQLSHNQQ
jgi:hypothetical protein